MKFLPFSRAALAKRSDDLHAASIFGRSSCPGCDDDRRRSVSRDIAGLARLDPDSQGRLIMPLPGSYLARAYRQRRQAGDGLSRGWRRLPVDPQLLAQLRWSEAVLRFIRRAHRFRRIQVCPPGRGSPGCGRRRGPAQALQLDGRGSHPDHRTIWQPKQGQSWTSTRRMETAAGVDKPLFFLRYTTPRNPAAGEGLSVPRRVTSDASKPARDERAL